MKEVDFKVFSNVMIAPGTWKMVLEGDTSAITGSGQFVNISIPGLFLRRPISVHDVDDTSLTIVFKVVGKGTAVLRGLRRGDINKAGLKDIVIRNVYAEVPFDKPDAGYNYEGPVEDLPRNISPAIICAGIPGYKIENVTLENIEIVVPGAGNPLYAFRGTTPEELEAIPEMIDYYPEFSQWKELPAWGAYLRHMNGITFKNVSIKAQAKDYRPCVVADDVENLSIESDKFDGIVTNKTTTK